MGMLDLFREWQKKVDSRLRPRRRKGIFRSEELESRRMLSAVLIGTVLTVDSTPGPDIIGIRQDATGVKVTENGVDTVFSSASTINSIKIFGNAGDDQITINGLFNSTSLTVDGGSGFNSLLMLSGANNWTISGPNSGTCNGNSFTNIQNLSGGAFNDTFRFQSTGFVGGKIDGGGGVDALDYASRSNGVVINLSSASATAIGAGFVKISDFVGSSDNTDILVGPSETNVWRLTSGDTGYINQLQFFYGIENITGGAENDSFQFGVAGYISGNIVGGGGVNSLDYSLKSVGAVTNLQTNSSTAIGSSFSQIGMVIGSSANTDALSGINDTNTWSITAANSGFVQSVLSGMSFSGYESLVGGTASDSFKIGPAGVVSGSINGGLGNNTLDYSQRFDGIVVNLQARTATGIGSVFSQIQNLIGGSSTNSTNYDNLIATETINDWNVTAGNTGNLNGAFYFSSIENLLGGKLSDTYRFLPAGFVSGVVNAGLGINSLDYSTRNNGVLVGLQSTLNPVANLYTSPATAIGGGYAYITNLIGSSDVDTLVGANQANRWDVTGNNLGNVNGNFNFQGIESLTGGNAVDVFRMLPGGAITGTANGWPYLTEQLAGGDWIDYSARQTSVTANLNSGLADGFGKVTNIQNVLGSNGANTLNGNSIGNALIGGQGADTIVGGTGKSLIIGGSGVDSVTGGSNEDIVIGSFTNYDTNLAALGSILAEWQSTNTFQQRVNYLRNGGGINKNAILVADSTVFNDAVPDVITGGLGQDWLWGQPAELKDLTPTDLVDTPINNPPILSSPSTLMYTTGQGAAFVNTGITVADLDSTRLTSATVQIAGNYNASQDGLGFSPSTSTGNITGSFNSTTGILTLSSLFATATVGQFQSALRSVSYWNSSATPTTAPRTVIYKAFDGLAYSNGLPSTIYFNSAPILTGGSAITYSASQFPTVINPVITVADANNSSLSYATVSLSNYFFPLEDFLGFVGNASTGNINGIYNNTTGVLTLNSSGATATLANFQAAMRAVTYYNVSAIPSQFKRTVTFRVNDGSAFSNPVTSTITIV